MLKMIRDNRGVVIEEPEKMYVVELIDNRMFECDDLSDVVAAIVGTEYEDVEAQETGHLVRINFAKQVGLATMAMDERVDREPNIIVYDERIGKIPYSYTEAEPDYEIGEDPELIRVECDETFVLSLDKLGYIALWINTPDDYRLFKDVKNVDAEIDGFLEVFYEKKIDLPLHRKLDD